ncbi:E3 ubiquitin-protein ligase RNF25 [Hyperolius riggenbachi]|uniref:E3 ubiquitin-protein ligase RNF25 n=1 Tax=Hyperolius riggenbachi TaxID=752182 RepID=UPI0035A3301A
MAEEEEGSLWQELQVLQSIYLDELEVSHDDRVTLRITLTPATADDAESQYVCLTLQLSLPPPYPDVPPEISVSNPRGLCDEQIHCITDALRSTAAQAVGGPVLYELIEKGKEMLTASNIPRGHCVICLYGFQEGDSLTKTSCFHHFHSHCLGRYTKHCLEQTTEKDPAVLCPVCRESLVCDLNKLQEALPPAWPEEHYVPDTNTVKREEELRHIYQRQLANGGIIDVEAEKNRFFISIQQTPSSDPTSLVAEENQESVPENSPAPQEECAHPPINSKQPQERHTSSRGTYRAKPQPAMSRPFHRGHHAAPHWRGGRGRPDSRWVWREEVTHRDTRGRGRTRGYHANGTMRVPLQAGSDASPEEKPAL